MTWRESNGDDWKGEPERPPQWVYDLVTMVALETARRFAADMKKIAAEVWAELDAKKAEERRRLGG